jgi:hypothetical protein
VDARCTSYSANTTPYFFSTSSVGVISIAFQGQPSSNVPSGPFEVQSLQPMHSCASTSMRPNGGWSSSGTQYLHSATGQYPMQTGDPAQPVQLSLICANIFGFFFLGVAMPSDIGSILTFTTVPAKVVDMATLCQKGGVLSTQIRTPYHSGSKLSSTLRKIVPSGVLNFVAL